jgi:hypothetical protein
MFAMEHEWVVSNTAMQKILDGKRDEIWKTFSNILSEASAKCRNEILTSKEKRTTFLMHWMSLHEPLEELMTPLYSDLEKVAAEQESFVPTDTWLYDTAWHLLEEIVVSRCGKKIQDAWIEAVFSPDVRCGWNTLREMYESTGPDLGAVADVVLKTFEKAREEFRKPLTTLSSAPASVEVELSSTFVRPEGAEQVRPAPAIVREQPASSGGNIAVNENPVLTLKALHDRRGRPDIIRALFRRLFQEIDEAWAALRQGATHEEIRERFRRLKELEPKEFDDVLNNKKWDARTWAAEIIRHRSGLAISTIKKYSQPGYHRRQRRSGSSSVAAA